MSLDLVIGLILAFSIYKGYRRGAVDIVASVVFFIIAMLLASAFGNPVGRAVMGGSYLHPVVGFFLVFIVLLVIGSFITKRLKPKKGVLSAIDRIAGAVINGIRMLLIIGLVAALFRIFHLPSAESANRSSLYGVSLRSASLLVTQLKPLTNTVPDDIFKNRPSEPTP